MSALYIHFLRDDESGKFIFFVHGLSLAVIVLPYEQQLLPVYMFAGFFVYFIFIIMCECVFLLGRRKKLLENLRIIQSGVNNFGRFQFVTRNNAK